MIWVVGKKGIGEFQKKISRTKTENKNLEYREVIGKIGGRKLQNCLLQSFRVGGYMIFIRNWKLIKYYMNI